MQMELAPAHRAQAIEWPENIIPIFQPAHCPELNPIERLWQFVKGLLVGGEFRVSRCSKATSESGTKTLERRASPIVNLV